MDLDLQGNGFAMRVNDSMNCLSSDDESDQGQTVLDDLLLVTGFSDAARLKEKAGDCLFGSLQEDKIKRLMEVLAKLSREEIEQLEQQTEDEESLFVIRKYLKQHSVQSLGSTTNTIPEIDPLDFHNKVVIASQDKTTLLLIHQERQEASQILRECLNTLQKRFANTVSILSMLYSPNLRNIVPQDLPILMVYCDQAVLTQFTGLEVFGGKTRTSTDTIEWELARRGIVQTGLEKNPREFKMERVSRKKEEESEDDDEW